MRNDVERCRTSNQKSRILRNLRCKVAKEYHPMCGRPFTHRMQEMFFSFLQGSHFKRWKWNKVSQSETLHQTPYIGLLWFLKRLIILKKLLRDSNFVSKVNNESHHSILYENILKNPFCFANLANSLAIELWPLKLKSTNGMSHSFLKKIT